MAFRRRSRSSAPLLLHPSSSFRFQVEAVLEGLRIAEQEVRDASWERLVLESFDSRAGFDRGARVVDERDHMDLVDLDPQSRRFARIIDFSERVSNSGPGAAGDDFRSSRARARGHFLGIRIKFC